MCGDHRDVFRLRLEILAHGGRGLGVRHHHVREPDLGQPRARGVATCHCRPETIQNTLPIFREVFVSGEYEDMKARENLLEGL